MEKCEHEAYLKRLAELSRQLKLIEDEKRRLDFISHILGYIEALETL